MDSDPILWLLQANDSSYPSGAYAHSYGLEDLVDSGLITKPDQLERFLEAQVLPALLHFEIPMFVKAHKAASSGETTTLLDIDTELDAWRIPFETREASRRIGSQRLELLALLNPTPLVSTLRAQRPRAHHLIVSATELSAVPTSHAARAFAYQTLAGLIAASMKLMRIGQNACQKILRRILDLLGRQIDAAIASSAIGWFNPLLEIASLRHARSHARLFIS